MDDGIDIAPVRRLRTVPSALLDGVEVDVIGRISTDRLPCPAQWLPDLICGRRNLAPFTVAAFQHVADN